MALLLTTYLPLLSTAALLGDVLAGPVVGVVGVAGVDLGGGGGVRPVVLVVHGAGGHGFIMCQWN